MPAAHPSFKDFVAHQTEPTHPLLYYPDPRLQLVCDPIEKINPLYFDVSRLFDDMWRTLIKLGGWGLAAPQIGSPVRAIICKVPGHCEIEMVDPEIIRLGGGKYYSSEGCLSWPGHRVRIGRPATVTIEGYDRWGGMIKISGKKAQAACIQHEIDHLDGINIADYGREK